jgi:adenine deaminase
MTHDEAMKLFTINPAMQLGIDKQVGSIEVGKDADLAIYNHDPLSVYAVVQKTIIDGKVYFDRQKDIAMRAENAKEKTALIEKERQAAAGRGGGRGGQQGPGRGPGSTIEDREE